MGFAPRDARQAGLLQWLARQHPRVTVERVLSGPGLVAIYRFLAEQTHTADLPDPLKAADAAAFIILFVVVVEGIFARIDTIRASGLYSIVPLQNLYVSSISLYISGTTLKQNTEFRSRQNNVITFRQIELRETVEKNDPSRTVWQVLAVRNAFAVMLAQILLFDVAL